MKKERTVEIGGEVLKAGDIVLVLDGNSTRECPIASIGTKRLQIERHAGSVAAYSIEDRRSCESRGYGSRFMTKTEMAAQQRRSSLKSRLRDLGVESSLLSPKGNLDQYPDEALEEVIVVLEKYRNAENR